MIINKTQKVEKGSDFIISVVPDVDSLSIFSDVEFKYIPSSGTESDAIAVLNFASGVTVNSAGTGWNVKLTKDVTILDSTQPDIYNMKIKFTYTSGDEIIETVEKFINIK